jgi:hypothetical protein
MLRASISFRASRNVKEEEGGGDAVFDSNPFGFIYDEARSRCEQYGGHWQYAKGKGGPGAKNYICVGVHSPGGSKSACDFVAGSGGSIIGMVGGSVVGPVGTFAGGLLGSWLGSKVCGG